jgi:flagellar assembly protein FliH
MSAFHAPAGAILPFEFRQLTSEDAGEIAASAEFGGAQTNGCNDNGHRAAHERAGRDAILRNAIDLARQEGLLRGELEGRRAVRSELETETNAAILRERQRLVEAIHQFREVRERYFAEVEQEVVKLALAIASRVLHREAQVDSLLLAGVVRVALEKMADRSGVVLRVAGADVAAWERMFQATEASDRPRVAEDAQLQRGDCVLETRMGTVELGVQVQLEEIEKGFFDLLNHRPVK